MIWEADIGDLKNLANLANEFSTLTKFITVKHDVFCKTWEGVFSSGIGTIFILDDFHGALGAVAYPDLHDGELVATEMFWIVSKEHRGGGLLLLERYEQWAKERGCKRAIIAHMHDSMPDRLKGLYHKRGYEAMETHYVMEV